MRKSEIRLSRFHLSGVSVTPFYGLNVTFKYGKRDFSLYLTNDGEVELSSWKHGQICEVPPSVKLVLWLKARQLGILEKHGFL